MISKITVDIEKTIADALAKRAAPNDLVGYDTMLYLRDEGGEAGWETTLGIFVTLGMPENSERTTATAFVTIALHQAGEIEITELVDAVWDHLVVNRLAHTAGFEPTEQNLFYCGRCHRSFDPNDEHDPDVDP